MATSSSDGPIKISKRIEKELHQNKVVIRKLPPDLTEEKFLETFSDVPSYNYFYFTAGDPVLGKLSFSRAYFAFADEASLLPFRDKYDGLHLESESGLRYRAVVEFAPYQGVPKRQKKKLDTRVATIEQDPDYQAFVEASEAENMKPPSMAELSAYIDTIGTAKVAKVQRTPLIDYLLDRKSGRSKRQKSTASDSKKRPGREASRTGKDTRKEVVGSSRSKDYRGKKDETRGGRDRMEKKNDEMANSAKPSSEDRPSSSEKYKERSGQDKKGHHYEENGEVLERRSKELLKKNKDRPDQAIYAPRSSGKQRIYDRDQVENKESGRAREREGSHRFPAKESSLEYVKSGQREYGAEDKPRRGYGGRENYTGDKEKRYDGGRRGDDYWKSKDSYSHENTKSHSSGHREK